MSRLPRAVPPARPGLRRGDEKGNAPVEFIGWSTVIVVPIVYLLMALSQVQAASFAVVSAADAASRVLEVDTGSDALAHARLAVDLALSDQGVSASAEEAMTVVCAPAGCQAGAVVRIEVGVGLPMMGSVGEDVVRLSAERSVAPADEEGP